jgi:hypothetical protein
MKNTFLFILINLFILRVFAQNDPVLVIDGVNTTFKAGISLPYWLKAGQTVAVGANALSISALEFKADSTQLKFNRSLIITTTLTVPAGMVWKLEGIGLAMNTSGSSSSGNSTSYGPQLSNNGVLSIFKSPKEFTVPGAHSWTVPPGITNICVELWGAGGNGGSTPVYMSAGRGGAGGGSGAYGYECITVVPGTNYTLVVGTAGGDTINGFSSFSNLFKAQAGKNANGLVPGAGGTANTSYSLTGITGGLSPQGNTGVGGKGADAPNGGYGGVGGYAANYGGGGGGGSGGFPGGGGGGSYNGGTYNSAGAGGGADGKVVISW